MPYFDWMCGCVDTYDPKRTFVIKVLLLLLLLLTSLRERDKREKSEEKIDCHHQDSNQGPSLVASDALTTELWCSRYPSRGRSTFSSDFVTHTSCESTQAGGLLLLLIVHAGMM